MTKDPSAITDSADSLTQFEVGSPTYNEYQEAVHSRTFADMEAFSQEFLANNTRALRDYSEKWSADPLNHWSRRWEYLYAFVQLRHHFGRLPDSKPTLLDAGSGITFFPGYLVHALNVGCVDCLDNDATYPPIFRELSGVGIDSTALFIGDLQAIPRPDSHYDAIYCISVLEHMPEPEKVVSEFKRVLKPGGLLVITFDVALQENDGLSEAQSLRLLRLFSEDMEANAEYPLLYKTVFRRKWPLTRKLVLRRETALKSRQQRAMFALRYAFRRRRLMDLTFFCCTFRKLDG